MNPPVTPLVAPASGSAAAFRESESDSDDIRPIFGFVVGMVISSVLWSSIILAVLTFVGSKGQTFRSSGRDERWYAQSSGKRCS